MRKILYALLLCMLMVGGALANNIRIIGIPRLDQDTLTNTAKITVDIAWDNSWRTSKPANHDAAWIFVKCWDGEAWNHVYLEDKDGSYVPGTEKEADWANKPTSGVKYSVTDREGVNTKMKMVLEPGYSMAWKNWHLDPEEKAVVCCVGYFLYRKDYGAGDIMVPGVSFTWNYASQGFVDEDDLVVKVFAVEMVYVPQGPFYLGGTGLADWQYGSFTTNEDNFGTPMVITSEAEIKVEKSSSKSTLWAYGDAIEEGKIPATWPKGYNAFYIMKYEMSQQAYCEFLNTLLQAQQDGRIQGTLAALGVCTYAWGTDLSPYRQYIKVKQAAPVALFGMDANQNCVFDETDRIDYRGNGDTLVRNIDGQDLAVNFVSVYDLLAYAEFAGLRPMTEFEYEKACRGPREPVNNEYAWGSVTMVFYGQSLGGAAVWNGSRYGMYEDSRNTGTEHVLAGYNSGFARSWTYSGASTSGWWTGSKWFNRTHYYYPGVLRVGIFADSTTTRAAAGATFWGVMNMSDNVAEVCISAVDTTGRNFVGTHGCGQINGDGNAINKDWHITDDPRYYITRGMIFQLTSAVASSVNSGGSTCGPAENSWNWVPTGFARANYDDINHGGTYNSNWYYWGGMVSARWRWNHTTNGQERWYTYRWNNGTTASSEAMIGIRCVRSAPCKGNEKPL